MATDISGGPLKIGEERARERGLSNIEFVPADVHHLPFANGEFHRVTSRLGVMFFADVPQALREIYRVLKPGGRVSLLAWGSMAQPYFETTLGTVLRVLPELSLPASGANMFRFGRPGLLAELLREAGFPEVAERTAKVAWNWPGAPEDLWEWFQEVTVPFKPLFAAIPAERREEVNARVVGELAARYDSREVGFQAKIVLVSAIR